MHLFGREMKMLSGKESRDYNIKGKVNIWDIRNLP